MIKALGLAGPLLYPGPLFAGQAGLGLGKTLRNQRSTGSRPRPRSAGITRRPDQIRRGGAGGSVELVPMIHGRAEEGKRVVSERAMPMMERLPFVARHAWFAPPYDRNGTRPKINLVPDEMRLTPLGEVVARARRLAARGGVRGARRSRRRSGHGRISPDPRPPPRGP